MRKEDEALGGLIRQALREPAAAGACPAPDMLAARFDRRLSATEQAGLDAHVSRCQRCQAQLGAIARAADAECAAPSIRPSILWRLRWVGATAIAITAIGLWAIVDRERTISSDRAPISRLDTFASTPLAAPQAAPPTASEPVAGNKPDASRERAASTDLRDSRRKDVPRARTADAELRKETAAAPPAPAKAASPSAAFRRDAPAEQKPAPPPAQAMDAVQSRGAVQTSAQSPVVQLQTQTPPIQTAQTQSQVTQAAQNQAQNQASNQAQNQPPPSRTQAPPPPPATTPVQRAGAGRGGADASRGVVGGLAESVILRAGPITVTAPGGRSLWRVVAAAVEHSTDGGSSWARQQAPGGEKITTGFAPSATVCWMAGKQGLVIRYTESTGWTEVTAPIALDIVTITATDAQHATVAAVNGLKFATEDAGRTWRTVR